MKSRVVKMLVKLRYLFEEGFEVGNLSGYDAPCEERELGRVSITYVKAGSKGDRRLVTEKFEDVTAEECSRLFLKNMRRN